MLRYSVAVILAVSALPAFAQSEKEISCGYQAEVVAAVQQARLDRVKERDVQDKIVDGTQTWPRKFNAAIPLVTPWVFGLPMDQVRDNDLGEVWDELCLQQ